MVQQTRRPPQVTVSMRAHDEDDEDDTLSEASSASPSPVSTVPSAAAAAAAEVESMMRGYASLSPDDDVESLLEHLLSVESQWAGQRFAPLSSSRGGLAPSPPLVVEEHRCGSRSPARKDKETATSTSTPTATPTATSAHRVLSGAAAAATPRNCRALRQFRPIDYVVVGGILALAIGLSVGIYFLLQHEQDSNTKRSFWQQAELVAQRLQSNFTSTMQQLGGLAGALSVLRSSAMSRSEMDDFVYNSNAPLPSAVDAAGITVLRRVLASDRHTVEAELSNELGIPVVFRDIQTRELVPYSQSVNLIVTWPWSSLVTDIRPLVGLELRSNLQYTDALDFGMASGRIVISNRVTNPLQPTMQPFSLVLFQPAYSTGQPPDTPQERVATCTGGTLVILNMFRFVGGVDCSEGARMCCALFDQTAPYGSRLLTSNPVLEDLADISLFESHQGMRQEKKLSLSSRTVDLVCRPTQLFVDEQSTSAPLISSLLLVSLLVV